MAGFKDFLNNNEGLLSSIVGLVPALFSKSYRNKLTGAHLTGAEKEANAFTAQQAQQQMAFQQQMRDTQYQSAVADMKSAGVNPALMYGSGASGNVAPSGAMASSVTPTTGQDPMGLVSMIANLSLLNAQKQNIKADTEGKWQDIAESKERIKNIRQSVVESLKRVEEMNANIRKSGLESDALEIANRFIQSEKEIGLMISGLTASEIDARISEIDSKIALLSAQEKATLQSISESRAKIRELLSQASLNDEQRSEVKALTKKVEQETSNLEKVSNLTQKDIDFYEWNHSSETSYFGVKSGLRQIPKSLNKDGYENKPGSYKFVK